MTNLARFYQYAIDFEAAVLTDDWSLLERHFDSDAEHIVRDGGPMNLHDRGRAAVIAGLRSSVHSFDRRCDARIPEIVAGPSSDGDTVWMTFAVTMRHAGLPDLLLRGRHGAVYRAGRIAVLDETLLGDSGAAVRDYFATHDAHLHPAGSPVSHSALAAHEATLLAATQRTLVRCYGSAKSEQDTEAALAVCHPDFVLATEAFGLASRNREESAEHLGVFFSIFPDYHVAVEGIAGDGARQVCWGRAIMTFGGEMLGVPPTGRTADIAFCSIFDFDGPAIRRERFLIDLADLCRQIEAPLDAVDAVVRNLRHAAAA